MMFRIMSVPVLLAGFFFAPVAANAHPHVFIEANLEIFRNEEGKAAEIRHVWRFDEIFSISIIVDFDENGDGELSVEELEKVAETVKPNLAEFDFYTAVKLGDEDIDFADPETFFVDYKDDQLLMVMAIELEKPIDIKGKEFSVSVSDPTYYVAVEIRDDNAVEVSGGGGKCTHEIVRPDFDALYAKNPQVFADSFQGSDDPEIFAADEYLTWVNFNCA